MVRVGLLVRLSAKPGKEAEVASFLESALPLANQETTTPVWFALRLGLSGGGAVRWLQLFAVLMLYVTSHLCKVS